MVPVVGVGAVVPVGGGGCMGRAVSSATGKAAGNSGVARAAAGSSGAEATGRRTLGPGCPARVERQSLADIRRTPARRRGRGVGRFRHTVRRQDRRPGRTQLGTPHVEPLPGHPVHRRIGAPGTAPGSRTPPRTSAVAHRARGVEVPRGVLRLVVQAADPLLDLGAARPVVARSFRRQEGRTPPMGRLPVLLSASGGRSVEGVPRGPCPEGQLDRFTPRLVGSPAPVAAGAYRTRRRSHDPTRLAGGNRAACSST